MNDRATVTAVSLLPTVFTVFLLYIAPGDLSAQPSERAADSAAVQPQRATPIFQFKERPGSSQPGSSDTRTRTPASNQPPAATRQPTAPPAQRPANDPMRFQAAPPPVRSAETHTAETPAPPGRDPAPVPQRAAADPMRFQAAPPPPAPVEAPASRSVADVPKSQAAPAPIRSSPAPRFEVRAPESRPDEVFPGPDEIIPIDQPPQFNAAELVRNVQYPEDARRDGIQGRVLVRVLINRNGSVLRRIVEYTSNHALDSAAVSAVAATKFIPAKWGGVVVSAWITVPVNFTLVPAATEQRSY